MEDFNIFYGLFEAGNYQVIVKKIFHYIDLETMQSLSLVNKSCHFFLKSHIFERKSRLRNAWLNSQRNHRISTIRDRHIMHPNITCDDSEAVIVAFEPTTGWSAHVYRISTLDKKFAQCLYAVDREDFPWTQFIGNCSLSKRFLVITPTTAEHEIHLWHRMEGNFRGPPLIIKQQMSDRYANLIYDYFIVMYRNTLFSLYNTERNCVIRCWSYSVFTGARIEKMIKKVVSINKKGIVIWEEDILGNHTLQIRNYANKITFQLELNYFVNDDLKLKPNDIIGCTDSLFILDLTTKYGFGVLDVVDFRHGTLVRRFEHECKPHHGWVVHCRSVAPPRFIKHLNLVPFVQYALCLDLELMQMSKKKEKDLWPLHVDSVAYNSSEIFYTDQIQKNIVTIVRAKK